MNTASAADLDKLPGVGKATAKKIIAGRPYSSVADLSKAGLSQRQIDEITPLVTVNASTAGAANRAAGTANRAAPTPNENSATTGAPGPGMVWVNTATKVYHREGDPFYGKTKHGKYMSEADAMKAGYRASKSK